MLEEGMATHFSILAWRILKDRGAWQAAVQRVVKSRTWLKWFAHVGSLAWASHNNLLLCSTASICLLFDTLPSAFFLVLPYRWFCSQAFFLRAFKHTTWLTLPLQVIWWIHYDYPGTVDPFYFWCHQSSFYHLVKRAIGSVKGNLSCLSHSK